MNVIAKNLIRANLKSGKIKASLKKCLSEL